MTSQEMQVTLVDPRRDGWGAVLPKVLLISLMMIFVDWPEPYVPMEAFVAEVSSHFKRVWQENASKIVDEIVKRLKIAQIIYDHAGRTHKCGVREGIAIVASCYCTWCADAGTDMDNTWLDLAAADAESAELRCGRPASPARKRSRSRSRGRTTRDTSPERRSPQTQKAIKKSPGPRPKAQPVVNRLTPLREAAYIHPATQLDAATNRALTTFASSVAPPPTALPPWNLMPIRELRAMPAHALPALPPMQQLLMPQPPMAQATQGQAPLFDFSAALGRPF